MMKPSLIVGHSCADERAGMCNGIRFGYNIKVFKVFNNVEYKGNVVEYNPKTIRYQNEYKDGDQKEFYHYEVHAHKDHQSKIAPSPMDFEEHVYKISIDDICTITSLKRNGFDMLEEAIPSEINRKCSAHKTTDNTQENKSYFSKPLFVCDPFEDHRVVLFRKTTALVNDTTLSSSRQIIQLKGVHNYTSTFLKFIWVIL